MIGCNNWMPQEHEFNPLNVEFILEHIKTHFHSLSFLNSELAPVVEILPRRKQGSIYPT